MQRASQLHRPSFCRRTIASGSPTISQDFRLTKVFTLKERYQFRILAEMFNAFNIANLTGYSSQFGPGRGRQRLSAGFGGAGIGWSHRVQLRPGHPARRSDLRVRRTARGANRRPLHILTRPDSSGSPSRAPAHDQLKSQPQVHGLVSALNLHEPVRRERSLLLCSYKVRKRRTWEVPSCFAFSNGQCGSPGLER